MLSTTTTPYRTATPALSALAALAALPALQRPPLSLSASGAQPAQARATAPRWPETASHGSAVDRARVSARLQDFGSW